MFLQTNSLFVIIILKKIEKKVKTLERVKKREKGVLKSSIFSR